MSAMRRIRRDDLHDCLKDVRKTEADRFRDFFIRLDDGWLVFSPYVVKRWFRP
jgi:hypothetical protein